MYCLKSPSSVLYLSTLGLTKTEVWELSYQIVCENLGGEWKQKYWKKFDASMKSAARKGWVIVPMEIKEIKNL
jgi:hypothetical protein